MIIFAVKEFYKFIYGQHFTLLTDHKPLLSIFGSNRGVLLHSANRLQRWATTLLGYDFYIRYQKTTIYGQADGLSRLIDNHRLPSENVVITAVAVKKVVQHILLGSIRNTPVTMTEFQKASS